MPVSIPTSTSQLAHRTQSPWQSISDALSNDDLFVIIVFACFGLLVSLVLLQTVPFSGEMAAFLSQVS
jgi:hypothetical protein